MLCSKKSDASLFSHFIVDFWGKPATGGAKHSLYVATVRGYINLSGSCSNLDNCKRCYSSLPKCHFLCVSSFIFSLLSYSVFFCAKTPNRSLPQPWTLFHPIPYKCRKYGIPHAFRTRCLPVRNGRGVKSCSGFFYRASKWLFQIFSFKKSPLCV